MNGFKRSKNAERFCDCFSMNCKHCRNHPKGYTKRYWRKWNNRHIDKWDKIKYAEELCKQ